MSRAVRAADAERTAGLRQSLGMWGRVLQEARKAGPKKLLILAVLIVIAVLLAWGNHTSDSAASARTLPRVATPHTLSAYAAVQRP